MKVCSFCGWIVFALALLLPSSVAIQCAANCSICLQANTCQSCAHNYAVTSNRQCTPITLLNCRVYQSSTSCLICQPTFILRAGNCQKDYSGCVVRDSSGNCQFCGFGTTLASGQCTGVLNCNNNSPICQKCRSGYQNVGNKCFDLTPQCSSRVNSGACSACSGTYVLNGFSCLGMYLLPTNCSLYDPVVGTCYICKIGYEKLNGACVGVDQLQGNASQTYSFSTVTQTASFTASAISMPSDSLFSVVNPTDTLDLNSSVPTSLLMKKEIYRGTGDVNSSGKCLALNSDGLCSQCSDGYFISGEKCLQMMVACLSADVKNSVCLQCNESLKLVNDSCVDLNCLNSSFSSCSQCNAAYSPNIYGVCFNDNCIQMREGKCQSCANTYILTANNLCYSPLNSGFIQQTVTIPDTLKPTDIGFNSTSSSNSTSSLNSTSPTFNSTSPPAVTSITGCDLVQEGVCLRCISPYVSNSKGTCDKVIIGCLQMDGLIQNCVKCMIDYILGADGSCSLPEPSTTNSTTVSNASIAIIGCLTYNRNYCVSCSNRYFLTPINYTCLLIPPQCLTYSTANGSCLTCASSYFLFQSWCLLPFLVADSNCLAKDVNNFCSTCRAGYYKFGGKCYLANSSCNSYEISGGSCLSCLNGFVLLSGICYNTSSQPNCLQYDLSKACIKCSDLFYLKSGICTMVSVYCNTYQLSNGVCLQCLTGYLLQNSTGICWQVKAKPDNCNLTDAYGNCTQCSIKYYLKNSTTCLSVSFLCLTYNSTSGQCITCSSGYSPQNSTAKCVLSSMVASCSQPTEVGLCSACIKNNILLPNSTCMPMSPACTNYSGVGICQKCVNLYYLNNGVCVKETSTKGADPNCVLNDLYNYCQQCSSNYFIQLGNCLLADQLCQTFDPNNGNCLTCYNGYILNNTKCYLDSTPPPNCKVYSNGVCQQCADRYFMKAGKGACVQVSTLCNAYDNQTGLCSSCYDGYMLSGGLCTIAVTASPAVNVNSTNTSIYPCSISLNQSCSQCVAGYFLSLPSKRCVKSIAECTSYNDTLLQCVNCGLGYYLQSDGTCLNHPPDPYCLDFKPQGGCLNCINGYYSDLSSGRCLGVSILCLKNYQMATGKCLSCDTPSDVLQNGICFTATFGKDIHCALYVNSYCSVCNPGYSLVQYICSQPQQ